MEFRTLGLNCEGRGFMAPKAKDSSNSTSLVKELEEETESIVEEVYDEQVVF